MSPPYRARLSYSALLRDLLRLLRGEALVGFPGTTAAAPARWVEVVPADPVAPSRWPGDFWEAVVVGVVESLSAGGPGDSAGWGGARGRARVDFELRAALGASAWAARVDYPRVSSQ